MVNRALAKADWKARVKALDVDGCRPYVEGAPDPITGRLQGPNIDIYTPERREKEGIPANISNAQYRAACRRIMRQVGLPPVGRFCELTYDEQQKYWRHKGYDPERDRYELPCHSWEISPISGRRYVFWHSQVQRGEMTREEHRRRVLEIAGLPREEASLGGQGEEATSSSGG
jgi:hypothetical protein